LEFGRYKEVTSGFLAGLHVGMSQMVPSGVWLELPVA